MYAFIACTGAQFCFVIKLKRVELLRLKFKRSTWKLHFSSTDFDFAVKVDIKDGALDRKILTWVLRST